MDEERRAFEVECATEEASAAIASLGRLADTGRLSLAEVAEFTPAELDGAYAAAVGLLETNRPAKALQIAGLLVFLEPRRAEFLSLVGLSLLRLGQPSLARRYYQRALALDADDPLTLLGCGEACLLLRDGTAAAELIESGCARAQGRAELQHAVVRARKLRDTYVG